MVPRNGWTVTIDGAGPPITAPTWNEFVKNIAVRLRSNNLDHHGWREEAIDLMCRQRPDIASEEVDAPPERVATGDDAKRFVRTMWEAWKAGAEPVSDAEQDRRAELCLECPKRGYVACFGGCGAISAALSEMTMGAKTRFLAQLHKSHCTVCGCELSSLTRFPLDVLQEVDRKIDFKTGEYWSKCWKIQNIPPDGDQGLGPSSPQPPPGAT